MLGRKLCKNKGYYIDKIIPTNVEKEKWFDQAVPFLFAFVRDDNKGASPVPNINVSENILTIFTFRQIDFKKGDKIMFDNLTYIIQSVNRTYYESNEFRNIKQYYITMK